MIDLETCKTGNDHWDTVLELVKEQYIYGSSPSNTFGIVHQQRYWASTGLEDFRVNDLPPAQLVSFLKIFIQKIWIGK